MENRTETTGQPLDEEALTDEELQAVFGRDNADTPRQVWFAATARADVPEHLIAVIQANTDVGWRVASILDPVPGSAQCTVLFMREEVTAPEEAFDEGDYPDETPTLGDDEPSSEPSDVETDEFGNVITTEEFDGDTKTTVLPT